MLLYEFTGPDPLLINLVAGMAQLKAEIDAGTKSPEWTVDELLRYLKDNAPTTTPLIIDPADFYDMLKGPPLNHYIANTQGDNVIFKGQESEEEAGAQDDDDNKKIVKQMAARATP